MQILRELRERNQNVLKMRSNYQQFYMKKLNLDFVTCQQLMNQQKKTSSIDSVSSSIYESSVVSPEKTIEMTT